MAEMRLVVTNADEVMRLLQNLGAEALDVLEAAVKAGADVLEAAAEARAPGDLAVEVERDGSRATAKVGPTEDDWYFRFFETGARPHVIRPNSRGALLLESGALRAVVNHPGMAARPFLRPALDENEGRVTDAVGDVFARKLER